MRLILVALLLFGWTPAALAQEFPALTGRVVDAANILPPEVEQRIEQRSALVEEQTTSQIVVATIPDLQGYDIADFGYRLGRHWGIGQKDTDNGVLLIVAPNERRVRVEVGYGLEPVLTDALSSIIIQQAVLPKARAGDLPGGVADGFNAIADQLQLPPDQAAANVQAAEQRRESSGGNAGALFFLLFFLFWIWLAFHTARRGRKAHGKGGKGGKGTKGRSGSAWPVIIWGGGGFGGGGGGGGFGGGGGGFGGGGASGGW